tara:strand:+ start:42 stop:569 length:528 start_codon:yes stop_codon:yes gene_type:complete
MRLLTVCFISFFIETNPTIYFKKPLNFDSEIHINSEGNFISKGEMSFRDGAFIYNLVSPYKQTIASKNGKLYVQDDDFQQVIIYNDTKSFFLQDLFNNKYETENFPCPNNCFKLNPENGSSFQEAMVSMNGNVIDWIRLIDIKDQRIFIKFENFKFESSNISYVVPQNYEIISND